jgi:hypothetical protein
VVTNVDHVTDLNNVAGDINLLAVDTDMPMPNELSGSGAGEAKATVINHVVQSGLQNLKHLLTGYATHAQCALINVAELTLLKTVKVAKLLFLEKANSVITVLPPRLGPVHPRRVGSAFQILGGTEDGNAQSAADANTGTCISCHVMKKFGF